MLACGATRAAVFWAKKRSRLRPNESGVDRALRRYRGAFPSCFSGAVAIQPFCQTPGMDPQFGNGNRLPEAGLQHGSDIEKIFCRTAPAVDHLVIIIHFKSNPGRILLQVSFVPQLNHQRYGHLADIAIRPSAIDHPAYVQFAEMTGMAFPYLDRYIAAIHHTTLDVTGYRFHLARFEHAAQAQMRGMGRADGDEYPNKRQREKEIFSALPEGTAAIFAAYKGEEG